MANRYYLNEQYPNHGNCVFISHQKNDKDVAKTIANYILRSGLDIYFDEYDASMNRDDPRSVVNAIKNGIRRSTHMLCVLSQNALQSKWMPWEIGYGYDRLHVAGITVKERRAIINAYRMQLKAICVNDFNYAAIMPFFFTVKRD